MPKDLFGIDVLLTANPPAADPTIAQSSPHTEDVIDEVPKICSHLEEVSVPNHRAHREVRHIIVPVESGVTGF